MLHLVETDELANPVPVGFLRADAVVIHTNDGMNLIAQSKWLPIHEVTPVIAVYLYSIIMRADHRSQMITWKNRKCSTKLLFYIPIGKRLQKFERVIMKRSYFRNREGAYQVTVRHQYKTENKMSSDNELKGLGGWLILVGIGVVIAPIRLLVTYIPMYKPIFEDGTWEALTSVNSSVYNPLWGPLLLGEIVYNSIMVAASIYLIYLFFSKHYLFPKLYIAIVAVSLVFIPLDAWLVTKILPAEPIFGPETTKEFMRVLIGGLIWVPYMLISKRVKATFVEKMPNKKMQPTAESVG